MGKVSGGRRITTEDFGRNDQEMARKLAFVLNPFIEEFVSAFQKRITIADNLAMEIKTITVELDGSGNVTNTASYQSGVGKITGLLVLRALEQNGTSFPTGAPFASFRQENNVVEIQHVTGLPASTKFDLTVLAITV